MQKSSHAIRNSVIASCIMLIITALLKHYTMVFEFIYYQLTIVFNFINSSISIKLWVLLIMVILAMPSFFIVFNKLKKNKSFFDYKFDTFLGINWRWNYYLGKISNLHGYCPKDDTLLVYKEQPNYFQPYQIDSTNFECDTCKSKYSLESNYSEILSKVMRQIDRKIRNNEINID
jgi:hypothetical protein